MSEKAQNESWVAEKFAAAHNRDFGTDYVVEVAHRESDSADAFLTSKSTGATVGLQICMATDENQMKEESFQGSLEARISETLRKGGTPGCYIGIVPNELPKKGSNSLWHDGIVEIVRKHFPDSANQVNLEDDGMGNPFGKLPFSSLTIFKTDNGGTEPPEPDILVTFFFVKNVPPIKETIQGAIDKKIKKAYWDMKNLVLLLQVGNGAHTVDRVKAAAGGLVNIQSFSAVWWVYTRSGKDTEIFKFDCT